MAMITRRALKYIAVPCRPFIYTAVRTRSQLLTCGITGTVKSFLKFPLTVLIPTMAAAGVSSPELQKVIDESETLYEKKDFSATYDLLIPHKECNDANVLWRLARAATEKGKMGNEAERKQHIFEAWDYISKALELDDNNFACHKWYGILLDYTAEYEGTKKRISNAYEVKKHFMRAIELNPTDATTMYCLGYWCFLFADMAWYERKIASLVFGTPPTSTFEEALEHFLRAEKAEPGFYNKNNKMIGMTYLRLKDKENAKIYFQKTVNYQNAVTKEDFEAIKDAETQLKSL
ncbi:hypothetical protein RRG08_022470 [Elysia crispata]|uniref:Regulator of microtubule dynamics protein 1 n=1 Tax=Elysia crispata TaxID=231223 RepID=A0AAE0Z1V6_9GAST|nr:hypothetical protein RRG08_022470 [Elysia crispata]